VSTLARIFEEAFTKPNYALEDFLDHTYSTVRSLPSHQCRFPVTTLFPQLYETETKRRIKKEPAIAMDLPPKDWFPFACTTKEGESEEAETREDADRLSALWSF
jgi:U3 small nucleolar RNA-associated protein 19